MLQGKIDERSTVSFTNDEQANNLTTLHLRRAMTLLSLPILGLFAAVYIGMSPSLARQHSDALVYGHAAKSAGCARCGAITRSATFSSAMAEVSVHEARLDEIDIEGVVGFAEHVLAQPARLWSDSSSDQRQRLQKVLFPRGVTYSPEGQFGTAATSVISRLLQSLPTYREREASPKGFEPAPASDGRVAGNAAKPRGSRASGSSHRQRSVPGKSRKEP